MVLTDIESEFDSLVRRYTAKHGFRTYDIIHVASALKLRCKRFLSFDAKANALAKLVGELDITLLPKAAQIEKQLRESYASGLTPLTEILRARDRRLSLERQRLDALRDYHLARVRHAAATGAIIPTRSK